MVGQSTVTNSTRTTQKFLDFGRDFWRNRAGVLGWLHEEQLNRIVMFAERVNNTERRNATPLNPFFLCTCNPNRGVRDLNR